MRASRLVTLLLLLQTRGHLTAGQLAEELEVSVRTVLRDVDALAEAGVPIYSERGPHGGIRLVEGYRTRLTGLTGEEAEAIFMSGLPGPAAELGLGTVVAAARLKVLAALPPELRARAARLVERFHLDASGWFQADEAVPNLGPLSEAVWEGRRVEIDYERGDRIVTRALEPMGLVLKAGVWYVIARTDDQMRTYRASRVTRVAILDERFERPEGFDLAGFWTEASSAYERGTPRVEVTVRVRSERLERLEDAAGKRTVAEAERLPETDPDGWLRLRLRLDWPLEVPLLLLRAGPDVEVLDPPEIRSRVAELARRVADRYGVGISGTAPAPASPGSA